MKIVPEGQTQEADSKPLEVSEVDKTAMVEKAKELLTEPMEMGDIMDCLEYFYVYGRKPEIVNGKPQVSGDNIPVEEGHESKHFTSDQLKEVVEVLKAELTPEPVEELVEEIK